MRSRRYRHFQIAGVALLGLTIGLLVGSHRGVLPAFARSSADPSKDGEGALGYVIPEIDFRDTPFDEAVRKIQLVSPVPIVVHWKRLAGAGLDVHAPIMFRARNVTLEYTLQEVVKSLNTANYHVEYALSANSIEISTGDDASLLHVSVKSYDVEDLLRPPTDPWSLRDPPRTIAEYPASPPSLTPSVRDEFKELIQDTIAADSWRENGGNVGSIVFLGDRLIVIQTWAGHRDLAKLLVQLRELPAPQPQRRPASVMMLWNEALKRFVSTDPDVAEAALRRRLGEVHMDEVSFETAISTLANLSNADLLPDWPAIEAAEVRRTRPITLHLREVTLAAALRALLNAARTNASDECRLDFVPNAGWIEITSDKQNPEVTRAYDLREWLAAAMGPPPTLTPARPTDLSDRAALRDRKVEELILALQESTGRDSWRELGGSPGTIKFVSGHLVVTQTWEVQEKIADLLTAIRAGATSPSTRPAIQTPPSP